MNNIARYNRDSFLAESYKLFNNKGRSINNFKQEIESSYPKFGLVALAQQPKSENGIIAMGKFIGDSDLKNIINECLGLLDIGMPDVVQCIRTSKARKLEAVTSKYHIKIYRDLVEQTDALLVKHRF